MNFFEQQDRARRNTRQLVLMMTFAVTCLVTLTSLAISIGLQFLADSGQEHRTLHVAWSVVPAVALLVMGVVLVAALYKGLQLYRGGKAVAERLGGRLISLSQHDDDERRVLNVVEEMAIASGSPVPPVYLIDDDSINAFAAGLTPQNAVIGITRGAICLLSRDELQGVIAHEFSHIHNGDMRLNTRLVSVLHGILVIGLIGEFGMRSARDGEKAAIPLFLVGAAVWLLGYTGTFFGNWIKAVVSREREYLADASAVQFTRNPASIGGALKKIGGHAQGSCLRAAYAPEFSHLFFGAGVAAYVEGFMATHPPLKKRIRRIDPAWDGRFIQVVWPSGQRPVSDGPTPSAQPDSVRPSPSQGRAALVSSADLALSVASVGDPQPVHRAMASDALSRLDDALKQAAHSREGAQALVYGLLLSADQALREQQRQLLEPRTDPALRTTLDALITPLSNLDPALRLALVDLSIAALKQLDRPSVDAFKNNMTLLIKADRRIDLQEWTLLRIVERSLDQPRQRQARYHLVQVGNEIAVLLGALARAGHSDDVQANAAFLSALGGLPPELARLTLPDAAGLKSMALAVSRLSLLWPLQKPQLLKAMARCIEHDGQVTVAEAELMRAVADILDCPLPPIAKVERSVHAQ